MMTLDEAIAHAKKVAENKQKTIKDVYEKLEEDRPLFEEQENACLECANDHLQLAAWLEELKQLRQENHDLKETLDAVLHQPGDNEPFCFPGEEYMD